ncbi:MAG: recombinase family protein [Acholeplasmataceae bacterium]
MSTVEIIQPINRFINEETQEVIRKKRVCAYARVSTDDEDQINSYKVQVEEYTHRIKENPSWSFVGIYADLGLSGTSMKKRPEFMKMVEAVRKGEVDLILVKSISRFARNVVDIVSLVHEFRILGCVIYFEKENMYSDDSKADFTLSVLSSIAQEESRSISTNVKWSVEKKFRNGIVHRTKLYGYTNGTEKGELVVNQEHAPNVRLVFSLFIQGYNVNDIVKILNDRMIPSLNGNKWLYSTVRAMLGNEKYSGDAMCQKTITEDYLTHKQVKNDNLATKYLVRNHHEAIVSVEMFEAVQAMLEKGKTKERNLVTRYPLTNLVYCGECHRNMHRHHVNHSRPSLKVLLDCAHAPSEIKECTAYKVGYDLVLETIKLAFHNLISKKDIVEPLIEKIGSTVETKTLNDELFRLRSSLGNIITQKGLSADKDITSLVEQEKEIRKNISSIQKQIMASFRTASLIDLIKDLISGKDFIDSAIAIKTLTQLVIFDGNKIVIIISKTKTTEDLLPYIDELKEKEAIAQGYYADYQKHIGLMYKVVYHD